MAATCLQVSAVLLFYYSNSHDRKTFFSRHAGLFARATDNAWRVAGCPLQSEVLPAPIRFACPPPLAARRANQVQVTRRPCSLLATASRAELAPITAAPRFLSITPIGGLADPRPLESPSRFLETLHMLMVISPAKTLDYETPPATPRFTQPEHLDHAQEE